jgi:uncharacterized SAM-binding protein YcdF (DUF218 family)
MKKKIILLVIAVILLLIFLSNSYLIKLSYDFLAFKDHPDKADIVIVLSGDIAGDRVPKAVELFTKRYAEKVMMMGSQIQWDTYEQEIMKRHAVSLGVPADNVMVVNQGESTYAQAVKSVEVMKHNNFRSAIIVTSDYHTRRTRYIFNKVSSKEQLKFIFIPSDSLYTNLIHSSRLWKHSELFELLFYEYTKLFWYWLRY